MNSEALQIQEIVDQIVGHLDGDRKTLAKCLLLSSAWARATRRHIFATINIPTTASSDIATPYVLKLDRLARYAPDIPTFIRRIRFHRETPYAIVLWEQAHTALSSCPHIFQHVRAMTVEDLTVNSPKDIARSISAYLPSLDTIHLQDIYFTEEVAPLPQDASQKSLDQPLTLRRVTNIWYQSGFFDDPVCLCESIVSAFGEPVSLNLRNTVNSCRWLSAPLFPKIGPNLQHLTLNGNDFAQEGDQYNDLFLFYRSSSENERRDKYIKLYESLQCCQSLRSLTIQHQCVETVHQGWDTTVNLYETTGTLPQIDPLFLTALSTVLARQSAPLPNLERLSFEMKAMVGSLAKCADAWAELARTLTADAGRRYPRFSRLDVELQEWRRYTGLDEQNYRSADRSALARSLFACFEERGVQVMVDVWALGH